MSENEINTIVKKYSHQNGRCVAHVQFASDDWTSPVVEIPSNGVASLDRAPVVTADAVAGIAAIAAATRQFSIDGATRNMLLLGAVAAIRIG